MSHIEKGQEDQTFCSVLDGNRFLCESCAEQIHKYYQEQIDILNEVMNHAKMFHATSFSNLTRAIEKMDDSDLKKEFRVVQDQLAFVFPLDEINKPEES